MQRHRIRVGVVGAGSVVRSLHLPVLQALPDIDVRWICDGDIEAAKSAARTFGIRTACATLDERTADADVALVAIPVGARRAALETILDRKQHAFCEKPFALTLDDHRWILSTARAAGARVGVALVRRVYGSTRLAAQLIASGALGAVESVIAGEGSRLQRTGREGDWYQASAALAGGGVLMETGPHVIDQVMTICGGRAVTIESCVQTSRDDLDFETSARATLDLGSGPRARVRLDVSRLRDVWNGILVRCERGELRIGLGVETGVALAARGERARTRLEAPGPRDAYAAFAEEWRGFLSRCRGGDWTDEDTGLLTTAFIDACYSLGRAGARPAIAP